MAATAAAGPAAHEVHNVLERAQAEFHMAQLRWEDTLGVVSRSRGIKISYNASELRASGNWVSAAAAAVKSA